MQWSNLWKLPNQHIPYYYMHLQRCAIGYMSKFPRVCLDCTPRPVQVPGDYHHVFLHIQTNHCPGTTRKQVPHSLHLYWNYRCVYCFRLCPAILVTYITYPFISKLLVPLLHMLLHNCNIHLHPLRVCCQALQVVHQR